MVAVKVTPEMGQAMDNLKQTSQSSRQSDYEDKIQAAISGVKQGRYKSYATAAIAEGVVRQTLMNRANGIRKARKEGYLKLQLLTPMQETALVDWCRFNSSRATPLHVTRLRAQAFEICGKQPGKNWTLRFLRRHPCLVSAKPHGLDPKRAQNFNKTIVMEYFQLRHQLKEKHDGIPPEHEWNMDETGCQMGGGRKGSGMKFIYGAENKERYRLLSDNLELVSVIECVNAAGAVMPPAFILKDGRIADHSDVDGVGAIATSPNGWTDQELCEKWFREIFVPNALACRVNDKPIVLTMDGHNSHETSILKATAYEHDIIILAFPSKTTHKLQPLDVGVFSSVQRRWTAHCGQRITEGVVIDRYNFIPEYMKVRTVITPELVKKSFERTGIFPLNPNVFTDADFAPSNATSTSRDTYLPSSYPAEVTLPSTARSNLEADDHAVHTSLSGTADVTDFPEGSGVPEMGEGVLNDMETRSDNQCENDEDGFMHFYYDPGLDDTQEGLLDFEAPVVTASRTPPVVGSRDLFSTSSEANSSFPSHHLLPQSQTTDPEFGTISAYMASQPVELNLNMPPPGPTPSSPPSPAVHGPSLFAGPPIPLPSLSQVLEMSPEDCWETMRQMHTQIQTLTTTIAATTAEIESANAHCTIARHEISALREQQANKKKGKGRTTKIASRWIAHPDLKETFESERKKEEEKAAKEAEIVAKKKAENEARAYQIDRDVVLKTFESPLSAYKRKDDLVTIARALQVTIESKDTVTILMNKIKACMAENPELAQNPRFSALFGEAARGRRGQRSARLGCTAPSCHQPNAEQDNSVPGPSAIHWHAQPPAITAHSLSAQDSDSASSTGRSAHNASHPHYPSTQPSQDPFYGHEQT